MVHSTFICENAEKSSITIDGVKEALNKEQVTALMDTIISKNIFLTKKSGGRLTRKAGTKFEIA